MITKKVIMSLLLSLNNECSICQAKSNSKKKNTFFWFYMDVNWCTCERNQGLILPKSNFLFHLKYRHPKKLKFMKKKKKKNQRIKFYLNNIE